MRCPNCDGERIVLAAPPGERPDRTRVCLACAFLWDAGPQEVRVHGAAAIDRGAPPR